MLWAFFPPREFLHCGPSPGLFRLTLICDVPPFVYPMQKNAEDRKIKIKVNPHQLSDQVAHPVVPLRCKGGGAAARGLLWSEGYKLNLGHMKNAARARSRLAHSECNPISYFSFRYTKPRVTNLTNNMLGSACYVGSGEATQFKCVKNLPTRCVETKGNTCSKDAIFFVNICCFITINGRVFSTGKF